MSAQEFTYTTGRTSLPVPDGEELSYNGCVFGPLFFTSVSGRCVKDEAQRTVKYMEYDLVVDGYVTAPQGFLEEAAREDVVGSITSMRRLLTAQGGALIYRGRGCELSVNAGGVRDVAWGPSPELLEFQPLGGGLSAKCVWKVKVRIPEVTARLQPQLTTVVSGTKPGRGGPKSVAFGGLAAIPLLQFNYETVVSYGEDGYSSLSVKGTLEIPLTRIPNQTTRTLTQTADDMRGLIESRVMSGIDLARFRITKRDFNLSRDKRTLEWNFQAEEKPYMDLPQGCTVARGSYSVKPAKAGMGLCNWLCTLRATYTVEGPHRQTDANAGPRRLAWLAFLALLRWRMAHSILSPELRPGGNQNPGKDAEAIVAAPITRDATSTLKTMQQLIRAQDRDVAKVRKAWVIDFNFEEGLYLDSKTTSFNATWRLVCPFNHIMLASGLWTRVQETDARGSNLWATSVQGIMGVQSWLPNKQDPSIDVIVDFGG